MTVKEFVVPIVSADIISKKLDLIHNHFKQFGTVTLIEPLMRDDKTYNLRIQYSYYYPVTNFQREINKHGTAKLDLGDGDEVFIYECTTSPLPEFPYMDFHPLMV